jgi:hypothetical protein
VASPVARARARAAVGAVTAVNLFIAWLPVLLRSVGKADVPADAQTADEALVVAGRHVGIDMGIACKAIKREALVDRVFQPARNVLRFGGGC